MNRPATRVLDDQRGAVRGGSRRPGADRWTGLRVAAAILLLAAPAIPSARAEVIALEGATVHTLTGDGPVENAVVLIEDGTIRAVGRKVRIPAGARRINVTGKQITPGLFDSYTSLGLVEVSAVAGTRDERIQDDRISAAFDVADGINPRSTLFSINRVEGLTRAMVAPGVGRSIIQGQGSIIHLDGDDGDFLVRRQAAMFVMLGAPGSSRAGGSRAAAILRLREALQDARDYRANRKAYDGGSRRDYAVSRLDLEALVRVVSGEIPLVVSVNRASDIEVVLRVIAEERIRVIIAGAAEGWMVAGKLAALQVPVILDPFDNRPANFDQLAATLENAARLDDAGVLVAFATGTAHNARNIKQAAGNAVAHGLEWEAGLRAITLNPARIWGLVDRIGTIEPGKEADLVVWDGDPLEVTTFADLVFIRGREMPQDTRQMRLRDRYRKLDGAWPPAYRRPGVSDGPSGR